MSLDPLPFRCDDELKPSRQHDSGYEMDLREVYEHVEVLTYYYHFHLNELPDIAAEAYVFNMFFEAIRGEYSCYCPFKSWRDLPYAMRFAGKLELTELEEALAKSWQELGDLDDKIIDDYEGGIFDDDAEVNDKLDEILFARFYPIIDADTKAANRPNEGRPETEITTRANEYLSNHVPVLVLEEEQYFETLSRSIDALPNFDQRMADSHSLDSDIASLLTQIGERFLTGYKMTKYAESNNLEIEYVRTTVSEYWAVLYRDAAQLVDPKSREVLASRDRIKIGKDTLWELNSAPKWDFNDETRQVGSVSPPWRLFKSWFNG